MPSIEDWVNFPLGIIQSLFGIYFIYHYVKLCDIIWMSLHRFGRGRFGPTVSTNFGGLMGHAGIFLAQS